MSAPTGKSSGQGPIGATDPEGLAAVHVMVNRLLAELDRVALELGMPYYLGYGTLIGAVRENALIPWDVDADVWVRHSDYSLLTQELPGLLGEDFELISAETHDDYEYLFPRLAIKGIHHVFVRIDIFPLDPAPRSAVGRRVYGKVVRLIDRAHFVKRADISVRLHYSARKRLLTSVLRTVLLPFPASFLRRVFQWLQGRGTSAVLINSCGAYGEREIYPASWFASMERVAVGELTLPVPNGYDNALRQLYGDYMTPVSTEQQQRELAAATSSFIEPLRELGHIA